MEYDREAELTCRVKCSVCRCAGSFFCSTSVTAECLLVGHDTHVVDTDEIFRVFFFFQTRLGMMGQ